jgi:hypothetical protein
MRSAAAHIAATDVPFRIDPLQYLARQGAKVQTINHVARNWETMICLQA